MLGFIKPFLSPLYGWIAAGALAFLIGFAWYWDHNGASRVQTRFDAYKVQVQQEIAAEKLRQQAEAQIAIDALEAQLTTSEAEEAAAEKAAADLRAYILSQPLVAGRGATDRDVELLNAR